MDVLFDWRRRLIRKIVTADIKKELDSKTAYNKTFLKTKINSHGSEVTDFYYKKITKVNSDQIC